MKTSLLNPLAALVLLGCILGLTEAGSLLGRSSTPVSSSTPSSSSTTPLCTLLGKPDSNSCLKFIRDQIVCTTIINDPNLIKFYLFNDITNSSNYKEILFNDTESLRASGLRPDLPLKVLIHGYNQNLTAVYPQNVKNAYINRQNASGALDVNVLVVDYGALVDFRQEELNEVSYLTCYIAATLNVDDAGTRIADQLQFMVNQSYTTLPQIHLLGHSLGAHVAGYTGDSLQKRNNGAKVGRFTALDPAGPGFRPHILPVRVMTQNDAVFVDVIHTNQLAFGVLGPIGQVDIVVNLALALQPVCIGRLKLRDIIIETLPETLTLGAWCSHAASTFYYSFSIVRDPAPSFSILGNIALVGEPCRTDTIHGQYAYTNGDLSKCYDEFGYETGETDCSEV